MQVVGCFTFVNSCLFNAVFIYKMNLDNYFSFISSTNQKLTCVLKIAKKIRPKHVEAIINKNMCNKLVLNIMHMIYLHEKCIMLNHFFRLTSSRFLCTKWRKICSVHYNQHEPVRMFVYHSAVTTYFKPYSKLFPACYKRNAGRQNSCTFFNLSDNGT